MLPEFGTYITQFMQNVNGFEFSNSNVESTIHTFYELSSALKSFYELDDQGHFQYLKALDNLKDFDWDILSDTEFMSPEIKPVLTITDDFKEKAKEMRSMLGFDTENEQYDPSGNLLSSKLQFDPSSITIPQPIDYSGDLALIRNYLFSVVTNTGNFTESLSNLRVDMNAETVGRIVAPYVSAAQGREILGNMRWNFTTGVPEAVSE
jgi:hypothetical protein